MGTLLLRDSWDVAGAGPSRLLLGAPSVVGGWLFVQTGDLYHQVHNLCKYYLALLIWAIP